MWGLGVPCVVEFYIMNLDQKGFCFHIAIVSIRQLNKDEISIVTVSPKSRISRIYISISYPIRPSNICFASYFLPNKKLSLAIPIKSKLKKDLLKFRICHVC
jgi:hypothetical protein